MLRHIHLFSPLNRIRCQRKNIKILYLQILPISAVIYLGKLLPQDEFYGRFSVRRGLTDYQVLKKNQLLEMQSRQLIIFVGRQ